MVGGVRRELQVGVVNSHLATWYGAQEKWSGVREVQVQEVLAEARLTLVKADLVVVGGDFNFSPDSAAYCLLSQEGLLDPLVELEPEQSGEEKFDTWGHPDNSWSAAEEGDRIDYVLYEVNKRSNISVRPSMYDTLRARVQGQSVSDHDGVVTQLTVQFK